jgi:2-polyprenyl-6-methoxyphenol hydroxylase-like FAD-dependent oxidoreductase
VLIVGAGPVGLTLALELQQLGVPYRIIDRNAGPSDTTKAMAMHSRTLEIFRYLGIADRLVAAGKQINRFRAQSNGTTILVYDFSLLDAAYPFVLSIPQPRTEAVMLDELGRRGGRVEWNTRFTSLTQDDTRVIAEISHQDGTDERISCGWLVGCDGARSAVRGALGVRFEGDSYHHHFVLADVDIDWDGKPDEGAFFLGPKHGYVAVAPLDGQRRYRMIVEIPLDLPPKAEQPTLEVAMFQALCEGRGQGMRLSNASSMAIAAFHHRRTDRQRVGRVFLAGDAAHIGSPAGGLYMNLGISEAHNLAWKLAFVHHGAAGDALLRSYEPERLPVAATTEKTAHVLFRFLTLRQPLLVRARDTVFPRISGWAGMRRRLPWMISRHRFHYRTSPIVEDARDRVTLRERRVRAGSGQGGALPRAGELAPDLELWQPRGAAPRRLLDLYEGRFTLLMFASGDEAAPDLRKHINLGIRLQRRFPWIRAHLVLDALERSDLGVPISVVLDPDRRLYRRYGGASAPCVLIRPDGYIAFLGGAEALLGYLGHRSELLPGTVPISTLSKAQ